MELKIYDVVYYTEESGEFRVDAYGFKTAAELIEGDRIETVELI